MPKVKDKMKKNNSLSSLSQSSPQNMAMSVEFGAEFVGEESRAARAVESRVKNTAARYGFQSEE
ncbi:MAG TPA: hypothetical protein DCY20_08900 [Firmicutes bacterium]|nr:hypothetical protein [Bacillota bacterium]